MPRPAPRDDLAAKLEVLKAKVRELEIRLKLVDSELKGRADMAQLLSKPELLQRPAGDEE